MKHLYYNDEIQDLPIQLVPLLKKVEKTTLFISMGMKNFDEIQHTTNVLLDKHTYIQQVIFDHSADPIIDRLLSTKIEIWSKSKSISGFLLSSEFTARMHNEILYPSWLFAFKNQHLPPLSIGRQYRYSCLNRNPRSHRLLLYTLLKHNSLLQNMIFTFYPLDPYNGNNVYYSNKEEFGKYYQEAMKNKVDFPLTWIDDDNTASNDHTVSHDAYTNTECNIVTESTVDIEFTSEKLWKPIASGQFFHVVGSAGTNAWLRTFGFETFDNIYDLTKCSIQRIEQVVNQLSENMYTEENIEKVTHNYHLFHSGTIEKTILDSINITAQ